MRSNWAADGVIYVGESSSFTDKVLPSNDLLY